MKIVFIVDDDATNLKVAKNALDGVYDAYTMASAQKMFRLLEKITPDIILLDVEMPEMNGFEALSILKSDERFKSIPVMFLTAVINPEAETYGFEMGAVDFLRKPFSPPVLAKRIEAHIETDKLIKQSVQSLRKVYAATIRSLAEIVENRDKTTGGHIARTQRYLAIIINELMASGVYCDEISNWNLEVLIPSAQLHDVGKVTVSDYILNKPGKLSEDEYEIIKNHCTDGERIIDRIISDAEEDGFLLHAKIFAATHHEKYNGTGYPRGLKGNDIPLEGRIMALVDVYDALVSARPYKMPFGHDRAVDIIKSDSGTHFDPLIVEAFLRVAEDFKKETIRCMTIEASKYTL